MAVTTPDLERAALEAESGGLRAFRSGLARNPFAAVILRRLTLAIPLLLAVSFLSFFLVSLTPGNAAKDLLGDQFTETAYQQLRHELGLNLPLYQQYWDWLKHALGGNFGTSIFNGQSVGLEISQRLPPTLSIVILGTAVSSLIGIPVGIFSALRGGFVGRLVDTVAMGGFALPGFWVGAELIVIFAVKLHWLPATGYVSIAQSPIQWLRSMVLPVTSLAIASTAGLAKMTRDAMLDVLSSEHIRGSRAAGLSERSIVLRHALKNASPSIVTFVGLQAVFMLGGTIFIETVFALPGLGSLVSSSVNNHDLPVVQGIVVTYTGLVLVINTIVDLVYVWLTPRISG
jgi:peptide/nickel transport system permease protein